MPFAAVLACIVIGIADGDSLTARCDAPEGKVNITVRVVETDAPEKGQAWGTRSKQHLANVCFQKRAEVRAQTTDRFRRMVARVRCDGTDASAEQVRTGMALAFTKYLTDARIKAIEMEARAERRGLWADREPVAPWEWRRVGR